MSEKSSDLQHRSSVRDEIPNIIPTKKKRSHSRDGEASRHRSSSSSIDERSKRNHKRKKIDNTAIGSIEKKTRGEHMLDNESTGIESGTSEPKKRVKKYLQRKTKRKKIKKKKDNKIERKNKKKKKKKLSRSSVRSRLIELILKCCSCLESLDSSYSKFSSGNNTCCCCKCRFRRPDCQSKCVQCDDSENLVPPSTHSPGEELRDSKKFPREEVTQSQNFFQHEQAKAADEENNLNFDFHDRREEVSEIEPNQKIESDSGLRGFMVERFSFFKTRDKRHSSSTKPLIDDHKIVEQSTPLKSAHSPSESATSTEISKPTEVEGKKCENTRTCVRKNSGKSTKALLIMFDIMFWPYTCLPKRKNCRQ